MRSSRHMPATRTAAFRSRLPQVEPWDRSTARASRHRKGTGKEPIRQQHDDISPEEIERRYQQRLAELKWLRLQEYKSCE